MKQLLTFLLAVAAGIVTHAQPAVGIGTTAPHGSAILDVTSTTKGILVPRMTTAQRSAISSPPAGLMVYDTDRKTFFHHDGAIWRTILNSDYWSKLSTLPNYVSNTTDSVAIGTLIPGERLDVNGNIRSRNNLIASNNVLATGNISGGGLTTSGNLFAVGTSFLGGDITTNSDISINNTAAMLQLKSNSTNKGFFQLNGDDIRLGTNSGNALGNAIIRLDGNDRFKFDKNGRFTLQADATPTMYFATGGVNQAFLQLQGQDLRISATSNKVHINDDLTVDDATSRVGIGVTTPEQKLHVAGNAKISGGKVLNNENQNMLPLAYGRGSGTGDRLSGSTNFISVDRDGPGEYKVFVNGLTSSSVILVTTMGNFTARIVSVFPSAGYFVLHTFSIAESSYENINFHFVVYNP